MDRIEKALKKIREDEKKALKDLLLKIDKGDLEGLDLKKLKARDDIFRVRKGNFRIIFRKDKDIIKILTLERRKESTYRHFIT
ncbi:hypothetical protein L6252_01460 [Candidatus Parcubacteria bacterium]|nr:hypothetical protein [Candidatus Parcubacteria bacterium]